MIDGEEDTGSHELEGPQEGTGCSIVIDGIHLSDKDFRMIGEISVEVFIKPDLKELPNCSFLKAFCDLFRKFSGYLTPEIYNRDAGDLMENIIFDVIIKSLFTDIQLRMIRDDLIRGLTLFKKRGNDLGNGFRLRNSQVNTLLHSAEPSGLRCVSERTLCGA